MINSYDTLQTYIQNVLARYDDNIIAQIPNYIYLAELKLARMPKNLGYTKIVSNQMTLGVPVYAKPNRWRSTVNMNYGTGNSMNVASRQSVGGVRTLLYTAPHTYQVGNVISVVNVGTDYNGTGLTITGVSSLSISYSQGTSSEAITTSSGFTTTVQNNVTHIFPRSYEYCRQYWSNDALTDAPKYYADYDYNHWLIAPTPSQNYPFEVIYYEQPIPLSVSNQVNWFTEFAPDALYYGALIEASVYLKNDDRVAVWQGMYDQAVSAIDGEAQSRMGDAATSRDKGI